MSDVQVAVASPPEYERLVIEIEVGGFRLVRVSMEGDQPFVEFDASEGGRHRMLIPLSRFVEALGQAEAELRRTYGGPTR